MNIHYVGQYKEMHMFISIFAKINDTYTLSTSKCALLLVYFYSDSSIFYLILYKISRSDLISTMTGGEAEIQDIQPYFGRGGEDTEDVTEIDLERDSKTVKVQPKKYSGFSGLKNV